MMGPHVESLDMQTVTLTREVAAEPSAVRDVLADVEGFTVAGGFDEVTVDDGIVEIENKMGLATMTLTLELVETDAALALRQRDGIFDEMETRYEVEPADEGSRVIATTDFELGRSVIGDILDATVVRRQRTRELEAQFDYLQERVE